MTTQSFNELASMHRRVEAMKAERTSFIELWRELSDFHLAHRGRFLTTDRNKGAKRNTKQLNNTSRIAGRTLAAGMMAGITSPARPWFRLAIPDRDLMEFTPVKAWLMDVENIMREIFNRSNTYNSLHNVYAELGVFGTASMGVFEDFDNVIRCKPYTIGSYMLALNGKDEVDTWAREYQLTVGQLIKQFGKDNVSSDVLRRWKNGDTESWVDLCHLVEPNDDRDIMSPLAKDKKFRSMYYELGQQRGDLKNKMLRRSGFDTFPLLTPRWDITGEDIYSVSCPGIDALGDVKGLQIAERKKYEAIDKHVDPPLQAPASMRNKINRIRPGDIVFHDDVTGKGVRSIYEVSPNLQYMMQDIEKTEQRVSRTFYEDLFLMLANSNRSQITAREVAERHEEKLLMLGPVLERLHNELLDPLIDRTFNIALAAGIFPEIPVELQDTELRVEYISVLAQAQRLVASAGTEQLAGFVAQLTNIWPEARHKFNPAQAIDDFSAALGTAPDLVRGDDEYDEIIQAEQQQQQQAQQQQEAMAAADTMQKMSATTLSAEETALGQLAKEVGG